MVSGFLKIALRGQIPLPLCPKKAEELSEGSGHLSLKPESNCEVTASPAIKGSLYQGGPTQGLEQPSTPHLRRCFAAQQLHHGGSYEKRVCHLQEERDRGSHLTEKKGRHKTELGR